MPSRSGGSAPPRGVARLAERIRALPERYRAEAAGDIRGRFGLDVDGTRFEVVVDGASCAVRLGDAERPAARIRTDARTWLAIDEGEENGIEAFLAGRLLLRGHVERAVRLQTLFHPLGRERRPSDLEHVTVRADDQTLSCFAFGDGPPLVLLHGLGASKLSWLPILPALAEDFRLIVPDFPGFGESSKPRTEYTPQFLGRVVVKMLDALNVKRAVLVGNSLGGRVAVEVARRAPKRVAGMVLLGAALPGFRYQMAIRLARVLPMQVARVPVPMREAMIRAGMKRLFADPHRLPESAYLAGVDEVMRIYAESEARMAAFSALQGLISEPEDEFWSDARRIKAPALVVHGAEDRLVPVALGLRLASVLPAGEARVLTDVGHVPQFEVPAVTATLVRDFAAAHAA